ncbi:MAG: hypothetical protein J2P45_08930 [Candidatus Dormibacteraeota bacterium]|nr:hypothetical protein [Candidatus Dormibacteraeota bacterium]
MTTGSASNTARLPDWLRDQARRAGGGWLDEVVGEHSPTSPVPITAIRGAWRLDANGDLTGEYVANPNYVRPSSGGGCPVRRPSSGGCPVHRKN